MFCDRCGTELSNDARFCHNCGRGLNSTGVTTPSTAAGAGLAAGAALAPLAGAPPANLPRPYRWGRFQGWLLIVTGSVMVGTVLAAFAAPGNKFIQGFARGLFSGQPELIEEYKQGLRQQDLEALAHAQGMWAGVAVMTFGTGIGLLKKRTFGVVLILLLIIRALLIGSLAALVFWLFSMPYYYKRRHEFRSP